MDYLTLEELAKILKTSERTISNMARSGRIPAVKVGRVWRFSRRAIEEWASRPVLSVENHLNNPLKLKKERKTLKPVDFAERARIRSTPESSRVAERAIK